MQEGTLTFPIEDGSVLLIEKKRGIGAGLVNGAGGKVELGESPREAAQREVLEELRVRVPEVTKAGELEFVFGDDHYMTVHVYRATAIEGEPAETDEAVPRWTSIDAVPYDQMWEDDRYWLPLVFEETPFRGWFRFDADADQMCGYHIDTDVSF